MDGKILAVFLLLFSVFVLLGFDVYSEELSDPQTESIDSVSESADQVFENVGSDVKPTESLEEVSEPIGEISEELPVDPEVVDTGNQTPQEKPLGVREAEGRIIGE